MVRVRGRDSEWCADVITAVRLGLGLGDITITARYDSCEDFVTAGREAGHIFKSLDSPSRFP